MNSPPNQSPAQICTDAVQGAVSALRDLIGPCATLDVAGACFSFNLFRNQPGAEADLSLLSPARQCSFLLAQLLASPEPQEPWEFSKSDWKRAQELLNETFGAYQALFWPAPDAAWPPSHEWLRIRDTAMPAFLHFFNTSLLASGDQIADRIRRYLTPFDLPIGEALGISASEALAVAQWIEATLQAGLDALTEAYKAARAAQRRVIGQAKENFTLAQLRDYARSEEFGPIFQGFAESLRDLGTVDRQKLEIAFPSTAQKFWRRFSIARGAGPRIDFPTERSVFDDRPLIRVTDDKAIVPMLASVFTSILEVGERALSSSDGRTSYFRSRDRLLEEEVADELARIIGPDTSIHRNVFENQAREFEHDVVALGKEICLIVEAKASPPVEPFRDPDRAFPRLRQAFRADTGIQSGFEQAVRIHRRLRRAEDVPLFDKQGFLVATIPGEAAARTFCVCVTRDSFGPLATDLALLLEKSADDPYPWVLNIVDLATLGQAWEYLRWGAEKLRDYIQARIQLHGKAFSFDELDYAGYFIRHGGLEAALRAPGDKLFLSPSYSDIFDEIHNHIHHGTLVSDLTAKPPVTTDVRRSMAEGHPVLVNPDTRLPGRNDPCPCRSGKKFKKCHGLRA